MRLGSLHLASVAVVSLLLLCTRDAHAGTQLGVGVGVAMPVDLKSHDPGPAADLRLGYEVALGPLAVAPEVSGGYIGLGGGDSGGNARVYRATAGARASFGSLLVPFVATHVGWGWRSEGSLDGAGLTADAQLGLDLKVLPIVSVGAALGYAAVLVDKDVNSDAALRFITAGLQGALTF